ncbi:MAG: hypothetical protein DWQ01_01975 [Planctomycetota bacterium]|nr:MAG: hypothetical protein DWQ01_01975 [Planctomycetota bacterium]
MDPDRWEQLVDLFGEALELPAHERTAFLDRRCGDDQELRRELERMLAEAEKPSEGYLDPPRSLEDLPFEEEDLTSEGEKNNGDLEPGSVSEDPPGDFGLGKVGPYQVLNEIGQGGKGVVYLARHEESRKLVALKALQPFMRLAPTHRARFDREGQAVAKLGHPGIVDFEEYLVHQGNPLLVLEYVEGTNLAEEIERAAGKTKGTPEILRSTGGRSFFEVVTRITLEIAEALAHAHEQSIIHRDIKPHNILLTRDGRPKVTDFGLARDMDRTGITRTGEREGTLEYMSPEQVEAQKTQIDCRTDIYSLGVVFYEMLTLKRPFTAKTERQILQNISRGHSRKVRSVNPQVPVDLETICHRAMERRPQDRYASAVEMAEDLQRFLDHEAILARPPGWWKKAQRWAERHKLALSAAALFPLLLWAGISLDASRTRDSRRLSLLQNLADSLEYFQRLPVSQVPEVEAVQEARSYSNAYELEFGGESDGRFVELRNQFNSLGKTWTDKGRALARTGIMTEPEAEALEFPVRDYPQVASAMEWIQIGQIMAPDYAEPGEILLTPYLPKIEILNQEAFPGAEVYLAEPHSVVGLNFQEPERVGAFPLEPFTVSPGMVRIVVKTREGKTAEFLRLIRDIGELRSVALQDRHFREAGEARGMVEIAAGTFEIGVPHQVARKKRTVLTLDMPAFWVDPFPVSMGEYAAFIQESGLVEEPKLWPPVEQRGEGWESLPATGMTWFEANQYAQWHGKRLILDSEWDYLWVDENLRQWSRRTADPYLGFTRQELSYFEPVPAGVRPKSFADWRQMVFSLNEEEAVVNPRNGVYLFPRNVVEVTGSLYYEQSAGKFRRDSFVLFGKGNGYSLPNEVLIQGGIESSYNVLLERFSNDEGFRCARRIDPLQAVKKVP